MANDDDYKLFDFKTVIRVCVGISIGLLFIGASWSAVIVMTNLAKDYTQSDCRRVR